jgi:hypothetical protein
MGLAEMLGLEDPIQREVPIPKRTFGMKMACMLLMKS